MSGRGKEHLFHGYLQLRWRYGRRVPWPAGEREGWDELNEAEAEELLQVMRQRLREGWPMRPEVEK